MSVRGSIAIAALLAASACSEQAPVASMDLPSMGASDSNLAEQCLRDADAPGAYLIDETVTPSLFTPDAGAGGTQQGADMLNACMRQAWGVMAQSETLDETSAQTPIPAAIEQPQVPEAIPANQTCPPGYKGLYRGNMLC